LSPVAAAVITGEDFKMAADAGFRATRVIARPRIARAWNAGRENVDIVHSPFLSEQKIVVFVGVTGSVAVDVDCVNVLRLLTEVRLKISSRRRHRHKT
jgi:hypothetical protein